MTPEEVRAELGKLPEQFRDEALEAYRLFPRVVRDGFENDLEGAIYQINWAKTSQERGHWVRLSIRAADGEFDTPTQPVTSKSLSNDFFDGKITGHQMLEGAALLDAKPHIDRELYSPSLDLETDAVVPILTGNYFDGKKLDWMKKDAEARDPSCPTVILLSRIDQIIKMGANTIVITSKDGVSEGGFTRNCVDLVLSQFDCDDEEWAEILRTFEEESCGD